MVRYGRRVNAGFYSKAPDGWSNITWQDNQGNRFCDMIPTWMVPEFKRRVHMSGGRILKRIDGDEV